MKIRYLILAGCLLTFFSSKAQNNSLYFKGDIRDSIQVMTLLELARVKYHHQQYDTALAMCSNALTKANALRFNRGVAESYFLQARCFNRLSERDSAIALYKKALTLLEQLKAYDRLASGYNNWALILKTQGKNNDAAEVSEQGLFYANKEPNNRDRLILLNNFAIIQRKLANYKKAIHIYYESLEILNQETDTTFKEQSLGNIYINLGNIYSDQKIFTKSLELMNKAESILLKYNMENQLATLYNNFGANHMEMRDYDTAVGYLQKSSQLHIKLNDPVGNAICIDNLGKISYSKGDWETAIDRHKAAIKLFEKHHAYTNLPIAHENLGKAYMGASKFRKGEQSLMRGLQIALEAGQKVDELYMYESLVMLYKLLGHHEKAILYYDLYTSLSRELNDQQVGRYIGQQELQSHLAERDKALRSLQDETSMLRFQINQRNTLAVLSVIMLVLVSILFYVVYRHVQLKSVNNNIILEQKLLRSQLDPHFIFNALGAIQHYIYHKTPKEASRYLSKFAKLMRVVLENSRTDHPTLREELETIRNYLDLQSLRFNRHLNYLIHVDPTIDLQNTRVPSMLIQPLIENAIEHGLRPKQGNWKLDVNINQRAKELLVTVEDNGIGMFRSLQIKSEKKRKGFGNAITTERLALMNHRRKNKIKFRLEDILPKEKHHTGTRAILEIPIQV